MGSFNVSQEFSQFAARTGTAFKDAGAAEKGSVGVSLPKGTQGKCTIVGIDTSPLPGKTKEGKPGDPVPCISLKLQVVTPEQYKGRTEAQQFRLDDHPSFPTINKIKQFYDYMENAGLPRSIRETGIITEAFNWAGQEARTFDYEVVENKQGYKSVMPMAAATALPNATSTSAMLSSNVTWTPGMNVLIHGKAHQLVAKQPTGKWVVRSAASGNEMPDIDESVLTLM